MARKTHEEAQQTRHSILDAAERVFRAQGVSATTLQQIAAAAGVTRGAVYHHFNSKHEIVDAMLERVIVPIEADSQAHLGTPAAAQPMARIEAHVLSLFGYIAATPQAQRVFDICTTRIEYGAEHEPLRQRQLESRRDYQQKLAGTLAAAQQSGELPKKAPADELAVGLFALIDGLIRAWILAPGSFDLVRVGVGAVRSHLEGLRRG
jgi:TetR/AcrR family acrAB operon transcriptional repressor